MEQTDKRYGNRISILGLWEPGKSFEYDLVQGGFNGKSYIKVIDWVALKAVQTLAETGRLTVVVQDNEPLHKSHLVRQQWARWQAQGLLIFSYRPIVRKGIPLKLSGINLKAPKSVDKCLITSMT